MTNQASAPLLVPVAASAERLASVAGASAGRLSLRATGSMSWSSGTCLAPAISAAVRWRMTTGLPRHFTISDWPSLTEEMSTSTCASASAAASGFIWSINGQATSAAPTTPAAPVAM